jgi:anti-anti-sigma factor
LREVTVPLAASLSLAHDQEHGSGRTVGLVATPALHAGGQDDERLVWAGDIGWPVTPTLRDALFRALEVSGQSGVRLDVRQVTSISSNGVAVLVGARRRAASAGRLFVLIDRNGPVTDALASMHLLHGFLIKQVTTPSD